MILYYDRDGAELEQERAWRLMGDMEYKRVARTTVMDAADPSKSYDVSTVWLGLDHNHGFAGPPLIFETMVFAAGNERDLDCDRYATEKQAREGHTAMVVTIAAEMTDAVVMDAEN